jgi:hypothetical protein
MECKGVMKILKKSVIKFFIVLVPVVIYLILKNVQEKRIEEVNPDILNYFYISCPNTNSYEVKKIGAMKYEYLAKYYFKPDKDDFTYDKYKLEADIFGNTRFYRASIFGRRYEGKFPQVVLDIDDSLPRQLLFHPKSDSDEIGEKLYCGFDTYISFKESVSYSEALELVDKMNEIGLVYWLWVDTYSHYDMSENYVTIQNPKEGQLSVHGIPLYYSGAKVENPLDEFLKAVNSVEEGKTSNLVEEKLLEVKKGINASKNQIEEEDIRIIGVVMDDLPVENSEELGKKLEKIDIVRVIVGEYGNVLD